jgi:hypothetical protein
MQAEMRIRWIVMAGSLLLAPLAGQAATCTTQVELKSLDRDALTAAAAKLTSAVAGQDDAALQANLLPQEASEWENIHAAVEMAAPLIKGGQFQLRNVYLLDASSQKAPANTQFFCSNASGSLTVTITMNALPPGRYAVILADAAGAPMAGQMGMVLAWDDAAVAWKLAGVTIHAGVFDGHDGVWYWTRGREMAKSDPWSAWFSYEAARYLLIPVSFISSPNLDKMHQEQALIPDPQSSLPLAVTSGDRTWKIKAAWLDPALFEPDLGIVYESTGVTDPAALRTEAIAVMSAFLKAQPGIRANFHGLWAYAERDGKRTPVMELPMAKIP